MQRVARVLAVVDLGPAFFPTLFGSFSEFAVCPLQVLLVVFVRLRLDHVVGEESTSIRSVAPVGPNHLVQRRLNDTKVLRAADVPVADVIPLNVAHVGAVQSGDNDAVLLDLTLDVVAPLLSADRVRPCDAVRLVKEIARSCDAMHQGAPETVMELVLVRSVRDPSTVLESDRLATFDIEVDAVEVDSGSEAGVAGPAVEFVGAFLADEGDRRVMADLLERDPGAIGQVPLHGFAEDRVKRLVPDVTRLQERDRCRHDKLHPLNGVSRLSSPSHEDWAMDRHSCDQIDDGDVGHAADGEGNGANVELAGENRLA